MIKEEIEKAKEFYKDDQDCLYLVNDMVESCRTYVGTVVNMENAIGTMRFRLEGQDLRQFIQNLDNSRRVAHNALIANVGIVSRMVKQAGLEPAYTGDIQDRQEVAEFAKLVCNEYFDDRMR